MKNRKGFTLIELLTVIAILAVILLIAAPTILGVLNKAKKNTFINQVLIYVEGLKTQIALDEIEEEKTITWIDNEVIIDFTDINMDSTNIYTGKIKVTKNNGNKYTYTVIEAHGDGWKLNKSKEAKLIKDEDIVEDDGKALISKATIDLSGIPSVMQQGNNYNIPTNHTGDSVVCTANNVTIANTSTLIDGIYTIKCIAENSIREQTIEEKSITVKSNYTIGEEVTLKDGSKWYVLENSISANENVTLFASKNAKKDGTGWTTIPSEYALAFDGDNNSDYDSSDIKTVLNNQVKSLINTNLPSEISEIRLIEILEVCNIINSFSSNNNCNKTGTIGNTYENLPNWIYSTTYWTMTHWTGDNITVFDIRNSEFGEFGSAHAIASGHAGMRPVIVTPKTNIK